MPIRKYPEKLPPYGHGNEEEGYSINNLLSATFNIDGTIDTSNGNLELRPVGDLLLSPQDARATYKMMIPEGFKEFHFKEAGSAVHSTFRVVSEPNDLTKEATIGVAAQANSDFSSDKELASLFWNPTDNEYRIELINSNTAATTARDLAIQDKQEGANAAWMRFVGNGGVEIGNPANNANEKGDFTVTGTFIKESTKWAVTKYIADTDGDMGGPYTWNVGPDSDGCLNFFDDNAGVSRFYIDRAGQIGIGITSPSSFLELGFTTENLQLVDAGSSGATEQDFIEVAVGGTTGYIRVFGTK